MQKKVLLVDDNVDMLLIGQRIFERAGYEFYSARTGMEGLGQARKTKPSAVILDYMLPDMTGTQFIQALFQDSKSSTGNFIPVLVLTARPDYVQDMDDCYRLGLRAYLNKPFGHRELVNVVENIIRFAQIEAKMQNEKSGPTIEQTIDLDWMEDLKISAGAIKSLCKELLSTEKSNLTERQKTDITAIYNSSGRLAGLINSKDPRIHPAQD
ncbi:response regulator [candidate division KSB1 bacterium]|nr:response regulator [candidate division KSB1 bacterium]